MVDCALPQRSMFYENLDEKAKNIDTTKKSA